MQRDRLLQLCAALALVAISAYIILSLLPILKSGEPPFTVYYERVRDTAPVTGFFLREELVLSGAAPISAERYELSLLSTGEDLGGIIAPKGGVFTAMLDGYEHSVLPVPLSPSQVLALSEDRRVPENAAGKLVTSSVWSFVAVLEAEVVAGLTLGGTYSLESDYWGGVSITLREIGETWQDFTAVRFEGSRDLDKTIYLRSLSARLVLGEYSGLHIPKTALYEDENGTFVSALTLGEAKRTGVQVLYNGDGFVLARSASLWDGSEIENTKFVNTSDLEAFQK